MPPLRQPKYCRMIVVVRHCGLKITKELFLKKIQDITPVGHDPFPWTVDDFLFQNRGEIIKHIKHRKDLTEMLYPGFGKRTNLGQWDISTFCFFLTKICKVEGNAEQGIHDLRNIRNELFHFGEGDLADQLYEKYIGMIEEIIDRCSEEIGNPALTQQLRAVLNETEAVETAEIEEEEKKFREWYTDEHKYRLEIEILRQGVDELRAALQNFQERPEENERSTNVTTSLEIVLHFAGMSKAAEEVLSDAQQGIESGTVPTTNCFLRTLNSCIERIKEDIRQMGQEVESHRANSIMLKFTCFSLISLIYLVDYFSGPIIQRRLQDVRAELEDIAGDTVEVQIYIPPDISQEIISKLEEEHNLEEADGRQNKRRKISGKMFNDPLYGQIELHPLCVRIIDTPQFQRLRHIKQLETCYLVYPGASHNRFEHSIGVCHLAGKLLRVLRERQPELDITTKDILCVEIAALCHDLGQGPFSHVFEHRFIPDVFPNIQWKHEKASVKMFEYMLEDNDDKLRAYFRQFIPGFEERDIIFIKELIGVPVDLGADVWPCMGRNKNKSFLYEIVANHVNGIDVDRWDYIARDSYMLGMKTTFEHNRLIQHARVLMAEGRRQICYRDKAAQDLYDMFYARLTLYRRAYQHKTHSIIGMMIRDALHDANDHISFVGKNGDRLRISDTIQDMKAYTNLTDDVLLKIQRSNKVGLEKSRAILHRILERDFYKCIIQTQVDVKKKGWVEKTAVQENLFNKINQKRTSVTDLSEILEIDVVNLDYGSKDKDPVTKVWFFKKGQEDTAIRINKEQVSFVLPDTFAEQYIRVYCSVTDSQLFDVIEQSFSEWCKENDIPLPQGSFVPLEDASGKS